MSLAYLLSSDDLVHQAALEILSNHKLLAGSEFSIMSSPSLVQSKSSTQD